MRLLLAAAASAVLGLALGSTVSAKPADAPARTFQPRDLFGLEFASDPQVRPDGGQIAYVRATYDIMTDRARRSIWLADPATGAQSPLVAGPASAGSPRWSPDGRRLAYVATDGEGGPQLMVRWLATGTTARVATLPDAPGDIAWSPDGRYLAFTLFEPDEGPRLGTPMAKPEGAKWADPLVVIDKQNYRADGQGYLKPGFTHTWVVSADGGAPRQLTFGAFDDAGPLAWTPDSRQILITSSRAPDWERDPQESDIFAVDVATAALTRLTSRDGPDQAPAVSPDGRTIAYVGYDDRLRGYENQRLYLMNRDGSNVRALTSGFDRSLEAPQWAADGKSVYVRYTDKGHMKVARVSLDGRVQDLATGLAGGGLDRPYAGGQFSVGRNGLVAVTMGDATHPADLAVVDKGGLRRLTRLNDDLFMGKALAQTAHLPVVSSYDKLPIDAWIVTPPNFDSSKKYPLILEIHGGPFQAYGPAWSSDYQQYAAAGYVVVYSNPRGSTSYGEAFANHIDKAYPSHDYDDLMSVVDAAIAKGFVDPDNLFVTGGSGGGVLTAWIIGKTDRFKAAAVQKPVIDWSSFVLTSDGTGFYDRYWFSKPPWEDHEAYWARSPLSLVGNVKTPTLVVVGAEDYRTPVSESEQYYAALKIRQVPTMLVKVPGASHGTIAARPSQAAAKSAAIIDWFDRYRKR
jgi:dipeptidyl aminopeptidase/acylaminoacyl peptidase